MKRFFTIFMSLIIGVVSMFSFISCQDKPSDPETGDRSEEIYQSAKSFEKSMTAQQATLRDCKLTPYQGSLSGNVVGYMDYRYSSAAWSVEVPETAYYSVAIRYSAAPLVQYELYVNETERYDIDMIGDNAFHTAALLVRLNKGENVLKVRNPQGQGYTAVLDNITVAGLETAGEVSSILPDLSAAEGTERLTLPSVDGFTLAIESSSRPEIVSTDGTVTAGTETVEVSLSVSVSRKEAKAYQEIKAVIGGKTPSAEQTAAQIFEQENGKVIEKGQTALEIPSLYEGHEYYIVQSSAPDIISRNGVISAQKDDCKVKVRYLVQKPDGTSATTEEIEYLVKGLGYEVNGSFMNPLGQGEDPFTTYIDGYYYHIRAKHGAANAHLEIIRSESFIDYRTEGFKTIYNFPPYETGAWNCSNIWGPFPIMKWSDGHYYIYYAADNGNNNNHREGVLRSVTTDPMGEYEDLGMINTSDQDVNETPTVQNTRWAIGATVFRGDGKSYLVWSGWKNDNDQFPQRSYIAEIRTPTEIGARVELASPTQDWEGVSEGTPLMEGQAVFCVNGRYIMLYSANASWAGRYRLGMLVYTGEHEGGFLNPENWEKREDPVFESSDCIESPGGPCLVPTQDGNEWWLLYHSSMYTGSGWTRYVSAKPIRFDEEGLPILDDPLPFYTPVRNPSGDSYAQDSLVIFQAEDAVLSGNVKKFYDLKAANGEYVCGLSKAGDKMTFSVEVPKEGLYKVVVRYAAQSDDTRHVLKINNKNISLLYTYYGYDNFFTLETQGIFAEGVNQVSIEYVSGYDVKIDFIGVVYAGE